MKKHQLDHILRAAGNITGERQFVFVGSQALHGKYPNLADDIVTSAEVELFTVVGRADSRIRRGQGAGPSGHRRRFRVRPQGIGADFVLADACVGP